MVVIWVIFLILLAMSFLLTLNLFGVFDLDVKQAPLPARPIQLHTHPVVVPVLEDKPVERQVPAILPVVYESSAPKRVPKRTIWRVTAYCPEECCCDEYADGFTVSGVRAVGKIIAAPPEIPFGTEIEIPGYGLAVVQDRGGAFGEEEKKLDVLFSTHKAAKEWGVKHLKIAVPKPITVPTPLWKLTEPKPLGELENN